MLVACNLSSEKDQEDNSKKLDGYVPDALTAKKIAEAICLPIYGPSVLDEKPYKAKIVGDSYRLLKES